MQCYILEVIPCCTFQFQFFAVPFSAFCRQVDLFFAPEEHGCLPGISALRRRSLCHYIATMLTCFWPDIDQIICCQHDIFIMFHNQHTVPDIPQIFKRFYKPLVIPLMKPIEGSSRIYVMPCSCDPICVASLIRCDSPPLRVRVGLLSVR